jgi:hypothetical protein
LDFASHNLPPFFGEDFKWRLRVFVPPPHEQVQEE